jgi:CheY-like chemotaxis protein
VTSAGPGRGSEFTIELPALPQAVTPSPPPPPRVSGAEPAPAVPARILVVDDNEDAAATLGDALEHLGYQVAVAHDGPSALRIAAAFEPDLALLDIGLPVMDGFELAERLRAQRAPGDRPHLVAVTGYGQESDRQQTARAGFEHHLVKPVNLGVLSEVVAGLVRAPHDRG